MIVFIFVEIAVVVVVVVVVGDLFDVIVVVAEVNLKPRARLNNKITPTTTEAKRYFLNFRNH